MFICVCLCSIKCLFENKLHFEVHSEQCLLKSGESSEMVVVFRPTQATRYEDKIEFEVNGLSKTSITVKGEGVPMKVREKRSRMISKRQLHN